MIALSDGWRGQNRKSPAGGVYAKLGVHKQQELIDLVKTYDASEC